MHTVWPLPDVAAARLMPGEVILGLVQDGDGAGLALTECRVVSWPPVGPSTVIWFSDVREISCHGDVIELEAIPQAKSLRLTLPASGGSRAAAFVADVRREAALR